jgi:hypothetical protein
MAGPTKMHALRDLAVVAAAIIVPSHAWAAGAAYQVDTAEISAGVRSNRGSPSRATDFVGAVSSACSVPFVRPLN